MRKPFTEPQLVAYAWEVLDKVWDAGTACADCEYFKSGGGWSEPPWTECGVSEVGENPFACPGVKRNKCEDDLAAAAEEAYERSQDR